MRRDWPGPSGWVRRYRRWLVLALAWAALLAPAARPALADRPALVETPFFAPAVASGALPKIEDRVPADPVVVDTSGTPGGTLRMLMAHPKDTRMMTVYGYARLVGYTPALKIEPDILASIDVEAGRVFTLHLRKGMKWSDGQPFTAEDFRYWFEDVAEDPKLSPSGLPIELLPEGQPPRFEVLDDTTVRYSWPEPNPLFIPALARADPLFIYCPAHYLKQFNKKYANKAKLAALAKKMRVHGWAALHNRMSAMYRDDNPDLPTLEPWVLQNKPPAQRLIFERNPYYYRVDAAGHQLPYIDRVILSLADSRIIPAKTAAGESDLQARYLSFDDYTFLRRNEEREHLKVHLWRTGPGSQFALYPNLNVDDPVWRGLLRDVRFRRALSLAINRHELNQVLYFGLAIEGQNTVLPQSPLYKPAYRTAWAKYDLGEANRLLDLIGLTKRNSDDVRLLPDGRPMEIVVEDSGEWPEMSDVLELIRDSWRHIGVSLFAKPLQLTLFRRRVFSGQTLMSIDKGVDDGLPSASSSPWEFAPTSQEQLEWPKWGQYYETKGMAGHPPDLPSAVQLRDLYNDWLGTASLQKHTEIWSQILEIWAQQVFSIGTVSGVLQPVVVSDNLRNVPEKGIYNWDPGAFFGMYKPDHFWFGPTPAAKSASAAPSAPALPQATP
ncbi:MAG TPA: ABC transporter substrate-binding protein [Stellaceae bacterium]|jgi:peptide/nickel transport system substrate-binding protein